MIMQHFNYPGFLLLFFYLHVWFAVGWWACDHTPAVCGVAGPRRARWPVRLPAVCQLCKRDEGQGAANGPLQVTWRLKDLFGKKSLVSFLPTFVKRNVCLKLYYQCWYWTNRRPDHHGDGADFDGRGSASVSPGNCQNNERSASYDGSNHGTEKPSRSSRLSNDTAAFSLIELFYCTAVWSPQAVLHFCALSDVKQAFNYRDSRWFVWLPVI